MREDTYTPHISARPRVYVLEEPPRVSQRDRLAEKASVRRAGGGTAAAGASAWRRPRVVVVVRDRLRGGGLASTAEVCAEGGAAAVPPTPSAPTAHRLGQFTATSIAGNDLLSSVLYTAGICLTYAGKLAPVALALVSAMLFLFRYVYAEVVTALPVNGGSYNALLNTTTKRAAALASCLSLLAYIATAVVSAFSAVQYVQPLWPWAGTTVGVTVGTVSLLALFAGLTLLGIGESAVVATAMFFLHVGALTAVVAASVAYGVRDGWATFRDNMASPLPDITSSSGDVIAPGSPGAALYYGYAAALLGITGFETAANYVEEMASSRVYVATLRNMWLAALFNPVVSLAGLAVLPMAEAYAHSNSLLAAVAERAGGAGLQAFVCVDGTLVLAGSVLTAYVGVTGLARRLAADRCLPAVLLATNRARGTNHWIILSFLALTASLFLALSAAAAASGAAGGPNAALNDLSGVYSLSFLSVMSAFALAALALKVKRPDLPRRVIASWRTVVAALACVLVGLAGTIGRAPGVLPWFFLYFGAVAGVVFAMFERTTLLRGALWCARGCLEGARARRARAAAHAALRAAHERAEARKAAGGGPDADAVGLDVGGGASVADGVGGAAPAGEPTHADAGGDEPPHGALGTVGAWCARRLRRRRGGTSAPLLAGHGGSLDSDGSGGDADDVAAGGGSAGSGGGGRDWLGAVARAVNRRIAQVNAEPVVFFAKHGDLATLNKAIRYVRANEQTARVVVCHVVDDAAAVAALEAGGGVDGPAGPGGGPPAAGGGGPRHVGAVNGAPRHAVVVAPPHADSADNAGAGAPSRVTDDVLLTALPPLLPAARLLLDHVALLGLLYPSLRVDALVVRGTVFSPAAVVFLSRYLGVPPNMMFMASPDAASRDTVAALGGVRVITRALSAADRAANARRARVVLRRVADDVVDFIPAAEADAEDAEDAHEAA